MHILPMDFLYLKTKIEHRENKDKSSYYIVRSED